MKSDNHILHTALHLCSGYNLGCDRVNKIHEKEYMILIAYHGNLYFDSFQLHVKEMKEKGFDTILFCISETDMLYNLEVFRDFREYAESEGMKTWATFWGYTAGEAVTSGKIKICKWADAIFHIGFRDVMLDEPKSKIKSLADAVRSEYFNVHLCLSDDTFNKLSDEEIINMPVKSLGLSCYHLGHRDWMKVTHRTIKWCTRLNKLRPNDNFVFIQAFDVPEGMEDMSMIVKEIAEDCGIKNFGVWSFRSTAATGTKRPINHKQIWEKIQF